MHITCNTPWSEVNSHRTKEGICNCRFLPSAVDLQPLTADRLQPPAAFYFPSWVPSWMVTQAAISRAYT